MALAPGLRLGAYEITALIGAGGMGEVYRARDARLGRDVAIKVLPSAFSADPERLTRFEHEARAAAALNHPNILAIHDVGTHAGFPYIVTELLEGETLRDRLDTGALPSRRAVEYAVQIAHGLAAAHDKGIVHRDLKPDNLFITADGRVKILDFGLAKLTQTEPAISGLSVLPTTPPNTLAGVVLGTIGYMSPEQVRGRPADHRSDIFALGVVLYEMLSGRPAFAGETPMDSMTAILKEDPVDLDHTGQQISAGLQRVVDRCLEKVPGLRFQTATDLAFALEGLAASSSSDRAISQPVAATGAAALLDNARVAWAFAIVLFVGVLGLVAKNYYDAGPAEERAVHATILLPDDFSRFSARAPVAASGLLAVSPDGRRVAVVGSGSGGNRFLWVRALDAPSAEMLDGTNGADHPFWAPDSESIGFFAEGKLKKIAVTGGRVTTLSDSAPVGGRSSGGSWSPNGTIVFAAGDPQVLYTVSAAGGLSAAITNASGEPQRGHLPFFLPDGRHYVYRRGGVAAQGAESEIVVGSLGSHETTSLLRQVSQVMYSRGYLVFARGTTLMAQRFDAQRRQTEGEALPIADSIGVGGGGNGVFSVSHDGVLVYRSGGFRRSNLVWFDRNGRQTTELGELGEFGGSVELSPDGERVAVSVIDPVTTTRDIWIYEAARGLPTRFTHDPPSNEVAALWSPDGSRLMYESNRAGAPDVYQRSVGGTGKDESLVFSLTGAGGRRPSSWSRDDKFLLYEAGTFPSIDLWALPLVGDRKPFSFLNTPFIEARGRFSPDGQWVAYVSNESGQLEVYVATFPQPGGKQRVSTAGGDWPRWRSDGKELFYLTPENVLVAVEVTSNGSRLAFGAVRRLFETRAGRNVANAYDVSADGQRVLVNTLAEGNSVTLTVIVNWPSLLPQ